MNRCAELGSACADRGGAPQLHQAAEPKALKSTPTASIDATHGGSAPSSPLRLLWRSSGPKPMVTNARPRPPPHENLPTFPTPRRPSLHFSPHRPSRAYCQKSRSCSLQQRLLIANRRGGGGLGIAFAFSHPLPSGLRLGEAIPSAVPTKLSPSNPSSDDSNHALPLRGWIPRLRAPRRPRKPTPPDPSFLPGSKHQNTTNI